jgi:hypothetical protein
MVVVPADKAVTTPEVSTFATAGLDEVQVTSELTTLLTVPLNAVDLAVIVVVVPMYCAPEVDAVVSSLVTGLALITTLADAVAVELTSRGVAVTVEVPAVTPLIEPLALIVIFELLDVQFTSTVDFEPSEYVPIAVRAVSSPTQTEGEVGVIAREVKVLMVEGVEMFDVAVLPPPPPPQATNSAVVSMASMVVNFLNMIKES